MRRLAELLGAAAQGQGRRRWLVALKVFGEDPHAELGARRARAAGRRDGRLGRAGRGVRGGAAAGEKDETALLALLARWRARTKRSWPTPSWPSTRNQTILELDAKNREAIAALERLYLPPGASTSCSAIYEKKLELAKSEGRGALEIRYKLAGLYEDEIKHPAKAIAALSGDPQAGSRARAAGAARARSHLRSSSARGTSWPRRSSASSTLSDATWPRSSS